MEYAARTEIECWLDPQATEESGADARSVHAELLLAARRREARAGVVGLINATSQVAIEFCIDALAIIQDGGLIYSSRERDFDGAAFVFAEPFSQRLWGDPLSALRELHALRGQTVRNQVSALLLESAQELEERASWALAPGDLNQTDQVALPSLQVGEKVVQTGRRGDPTAEPGAHADRQRKAALAAATRFRAKLEGRTPVELRGICGSIRMSLQCVREGSAPAAIMLPSAPTGAECEAIASAYENLARELPILGNCKVKGANRSLALEAWSVLAAWTQVLVVLSGWIRALGASAATRRCELCYRHRETKKRCGQHIAKSGITPEIRLAIAIQPAYVEMARRIVRARNLKAHEVNTSEWNLLERHARDFNVPEPLLRQCCFLAAQLRRLYPSIGSSLAEDVALLFEALVLHATELYERRQRLRSRSGSTPADLSAGALLSLRVLFIIWCASGRPYPRTAPAIIGRRHDPAHPLVRGTSPIEEDVAECLARQQAWHLACKVHDDFSKGIGATVADLVAQKFSYDEIGARFGFSHETARRIHKRGALPRMRARFKPYTAKGRRCSAHTSEVSAVAPVED